MANRIAVVTGANRGLGLATAKALAQQNHTLILTARTQLKADEAAATLAKDHLEVYPFALDIASDPSVDAFFDELQRRFGRVDVLVNNAAAIFERDDPNTLAVPTRTILDALNTNTLGNHRTIRRALPGMNERGFGRIVNVTSGMGSLTDMGGGHPAYRISKAALNALTRIFHHEARGNIKINAVCPGWVRTDMGGSSATRSIPEGIAGIVWAATLPDDGPSGGLFRDGEPIPW